MKPTRPALVVLLALCAADVATAEAPDETLVFPREVIEEASAELMAEAGIPGRGPKT